jgi:two-component system, cell cycle sensor histidine kinase and response regulator CckA
MYECFIFIHREDLAMGRKPIYEELEKSVKDTDQEAHESTRADEALRESESRYRRLFETAQDGILILDAGTGQIADVNPFLLEMLGYSHNEFLNKKLWEIGFFKDVEESRLAFNELQEKGYVRYEHLPLETKDGLPIDVEFVSNAYWVNNKQVIQCNIRDITERKKAEELRRKLESQLRQSQKMEVIATLAGGIAHQFNNALSVITVNLDFLEMDLPGDENILKRIESMQHAAQRMTQLTGQLLAYARGGKYQARNISFNDFVTDTLPLLQHTLKPSVYVETDLPHGVWKIRGDLIQMQMVLSAILANSSEAIEKQGLIRITSRNEIVTEEKARGFPGLKPGAYVDLKMEDNGKGMDEETRSRVFEPFFTTKFQGRGLGMAAAYGIVKNHNGWISIESQLDRGTIVHIYLPAILDADARRAKTPKIEPHKATGTILLIEDEEMVMDVSRALLAHLGYLVLEAKTGEEAIRISRTFEGNIDLAILDILLPDMNGKAVYPFLMETRPNLKVIVCSGYSLEGPAQEILDAGAQGFVQKPFSLATLSVKMQEVMQG